MGDDPIKPVIAMPKRKPLKWQEIFAVDVTPITGDLHDLPRLTLTVASQTDAEPLWDYLVRRYHYLGCKQLLGHRLKYLAFVGERPVAALSFSGPALKLRGRERFIGWSDEQRKTHLDRIVSNSRFLILPWVKVANLASHLLGIACARIAPDWEERFDTRPWLLETFIDPDRFKATSYRAANWQLIGRTYGCGKQGKGYVYHGVSKEVYAYVLEPRFRELIGCENKYFRPLHRPSRRRGLSTLQSTKKAEDLKMVLHGPEFSPDIVPGMELTEEDHKSIIDELHAFHGEFTDCYGRVEHGLRGITYLSGLLSDSEVKSIEPIALKLEDEKAVRPMQKFMKNGRWDHELMAETHRTLLAREIADPGGMLNLDSSEFLKKGKESVGTASQYCGRYGKVDNCQSGVFVGYSSYKGYGLLAGQLYMPEICFTKEYEERRKFNLVPEDLVFKTKIQIASEMLKNVIETARFPYKWIGVDATFGSDWAFLDALPKDKYYFASIKSNTKIFFRKPEVGVPPYRGHGPRPTEPRVLQGKAYDVSDAAHLMTRWTKVVLAEGAKGPIVAHVAAQRVIPCLNGLPHGRGVWLFMRRMENGEIKYAFSNAPSATPFAELCRAAMMRWPIEQCFQDGKSEVGMGQYEHRSWPAWHRHMIFVFLALHFLLRLRIQFKKKAPALTLPQAKRLVAALFNEKKTLGRTRTILAYHTRRNHIAYRSHRRKKMAELANDPTVKWFTQWRDAV